MVKLCLIWCLQDYDLEGKYAKTWIPELKNVSSKRIHEPWLMSQSEQQQFGVSIGQDYPTPIPSSQLVRPHGSKHSVMLTILSPFVLARVCPQSRETLMSVPSISGFRLHLEMGVAVKTVIFLYPQSIPLLAARLAEILLSCVCTFRSLQHHTDRPAMSAQTTNTCSRLLVFLPPFLSTLVQEIALTHSS